MSLRTVRHIERGQVEHPRRETIRRLADVLGGEDGWPRGDVDARLRIEVLGPLRVTRGGRELNLGPLKQRTLFAVLALHPNTVVGREELIDALWGELPPHSCRNLLHTYVSGLRKILEPGPVSEAGSIIASVGGGYRLAAGPDELDLAEFTELVGRARHAQPGEARKQLFAGALDLWRGAVLVDLPHSVRQHPVAVTLASRRVAAALAYGDTASALDDGDDAIDRLRLVAHHEPLHEGVHARLMMVLAAAGQQAAALRTLTDIRRRLGEELGIRPGEEIRLAYEKVTLAARRAHDPLIAQLSAKAAGFTGGAGSMTTLTDPVPVVPIARAKRQPHSRRLPDDLQRLTLCSCASVLPPRAEQTLRGTRRLFPKPAEQLPLTGGNPASGPPVRKPSDQCSECFLGQPV